MCDNRGLDIFAERQFENNRSLEHPRNGRPEFFDCHSQRVKRGIGHRVRPEFLQPTARFFACQAAWRLDCGGAC